MSSSLDSVVLELQGLKTDIQTRRGVVHAVDGVSLSLHLGEVVGLVGESGSGKSLTCFSIVRVLPAGGHIVSGSVRFKGVELTRLSEADMRKVRGGGIGMILQDPLASLNPLARTGSQVAETIRAHRRDRPTSGDDAGSRVSVSRQVLGLFEALRIPAPERRVRDYPHQMSGGMKQRVVAAIGLAGQPEVLIADEPTTALDVTVQAQMLRLLKDLQESRGMSMILVTHDLAVAAEVCDRIAVMYAGRIVEVGPTAAIFEAAQHQYTRGLLRSLPRMGSRLRRLETIEGQPSSGDALTRGCAFAVRCQAVKSRCIEELPSPVEVSKGHWHYCWNPGDSHSREDDGSS